MKNTFLKRKSRPRKVGPAFAEPPEGGEWLSSLTATIGTAPHGARPDEAGEQRRLPAKGLLYRFRMKPLTGRTIVVRDAEMDDTDTILFSVDH